MADEAQEDEEVLYKPSKKPLILAAVGALVIGAGGGFGAAMFLGGGEAEAAEADEEGEGDGEADADVDVDTEEPLSAVVVSLGRFTVNLRGASGGRILRTQIEVEVATDDAPKVEEGMAMLRDGVILLASDYSYTDLDGLDGKLRLRDELHARLNALVGEPVVRRVYFTEFVVQ